MEKQSRYEAYKLHKVVGIISFIMIILLSAVFYFLYTYGNSLKIKNNDISNKIAVVDKEIKEYEAQIQDSNNDYLTTVLNTAFEESAVKDALSSKLNYSILVNNNPVTKDLQIDITEPNVTITVKESCSVKNIPANIIEKYSLMNDISKYVTVTSTSIAPQSTASKTAESSSTVYSFKDLKAGDIVTVLIDRKLSNTMNLPSNVIEIFYTKEG